MRGKLLVLPLGLALIVNACGDDEEDKPTAQGGRAGGGAAGTAGTSQRGGNANAGTSGAHEGGSEDGAGGDTSMGGSGARAGAGGGAEPSAGGDGGSATAVGGADPGAAGSGPTASCDEGGGPVGTPLPSCAPAPSEEPCSLCIEANCCDEIRNCYATEPYNVCGYGGPATWPEFGGEFACTVDCINFAVDPGEVTPDVVQDCLSSCATPICNLTGDATLALTTCAYQECDAVCFY